MFATILLVFFVPICILMILIVLLQAGKGGGLAGAFGGGGGQTFLGARGAADFLSKLTVYLAVGFMLLSLILSLTYAPESSDTVRDRPGEKLDGTDVEGTPAGQVEVAPDTADTPDTPDTPDAPDASQPETPSSDEGDTATSPE